MVLARSRSLFFLAFLASGVMLGATLYLQFAVGLYPCSLYQVQRFFMTAFVVVSLAAALHGAGPVGSRAYAWAGLLTALGGGLAALRQLWLQGNGQNVEALCQGGFDCLWQSEPVAETLKSLLLGGAECARVNWSLLDMTWPEWSLLGFVAMILFCTLQLIQRQRPRAVAP